jgi:hypothetical protein
MSQQPPDWFRQPRGPRIGCADVTIVSIASIVAFVLLIFVVLRPDFARFIDLTGGNDITVGAVRATETPGGPALSITPGTAGVSDTTAAGSGSGTSAAGTTAPGTTGPAGTTGAVTTAVALTTAAAPTTPTIAPTPTPPPTVSFKSVKLTDACRLRQNPSYQAPIIQIFPKGTAFKAYDQQQSVKDTSTGVTETWQKVEPADNTNRQGWMVVECLGT